MQTLKARYRRFDVDAQKASCVSVPHCQRHCEEIACYLPFKPIYLAVLLLTGRLLVAVPEELLPVAVATVA